MPAEKTDAHFQAPEIPTDGFSDWLDRTRRAQTTGQGADVPCGACRGCCTSAYFIPIGPGETETLARIPRKFRFPAPGLPQGHVLLGYDENGHCPMFVDNACSIYAHRPQTCRDYDCRIFPATGLPVDEGKPAISRQAGRWKFGFPSARDIRRFSAVQAAAKLLGRHAASFPPGFVPGNPTQQAVVALKVHEVLLDPEHRLALAGGAPEPETVKAMVAAFERFGTGNAPPRSRTPVFRTPSDKGEKDMPTERTRFETVDEYIAFFPKEVGATLEKIRKAVKKAAPEAEEVISYQIPALRLHGMLIFYSAFKKHYSLSMPPSSAAFKAFKKELSRYEVSKSTIQFPMDEPIPLELLRDITKLRVRENLDNAKKKKKK
ncbi:MAG TPA: DUF1801 domain-containing protein [Fibrobacteria bacterium]|nr:DUF1801 domain-containing protein [Fibrobacteria bacterium]